MKMKIYLNFDDVVWEYFKSFWEFSDFIQKVYDNKVLWFLMVIYL